VGAGRGRVDADFYVQAAATAILVHNNTCEVGPGEDGPIAETPELNLVKANPRYVEEVTGENPEDIKAEIVGKGGSRYDLYVDKNTGELYVLRKGGVGEPQPTGLRLPR
jgi:hypothetical protein